MDGRTEETKLTFDDTPSRFQGEKHIDHIKHEEKHTICVPAFEFLQHRCFFFCQL